MKGRQDTLDNKLMAVKRENEALWRELTVLRQKHAKQQQIVSKVYSNYDNRHFFVTQCDSILEYICFVVAPIPCGNDVVAKPSLRIQAENACHSAFDAE